MKSNSSMEMYSLDSQTSNNCASFIWHILLSTKYVKSLSCVMLNKFAIIDRSKSHIYIVIFCKLFIVLLNCRSSAVLWWTNLTKIVQSLSDDCHALLTLATARLLTVINTELYGRRLWGSVDNFQDVAHHIINSLTCSNHVTISYWHRPCSLWVRGTSPLNILTYFVRMVASFTNWYHGEILSNVVFCSLHWSLLTVLISTGAVYWISLIWKSFFLYMQCRYVFMSIIFIWHLCHLVGL